MSSSSSTDTAPSAPRSDSRGRSTSRKRKKKSPPPASIPLTKDQELKALFCRRLKEKYYATVADEHKRIHPKLLDRNRVDLVVKPVLTITSGEHPVILTCLLQYSRVSLFHSIVRFTTGQVAQLHFQFSDFINLLNDSNMHLLLNQTNLGFRSECVREFLKSVTPIDQQLAVNADIIILKDKRTQVVLVYNLHGAGNYIAAKIHGEGMYDTTRKLLVNLAIMRIICCPAVGTLPILLQACIIANREHVEANIGSFLPLDANEQIFSYKEESLNSLLTFVRKNAPKSYNAFFIHAIKQDNNFGIVCLDNE